MNHSNASISLTRRQFLKATGATAALAVVGDKLMIGPSSTLVAHAEKSQLATEDVWLPSACYMCFTDCPVLVHRVDGVPVKIKGSPKGPNQGKICARGQAGLMKLNNPYRIKAPLKRTNPQKGRGVDPKWVEISWDEALDTVAARLKKIRAENPKKLLVMSGWGSRIWGGESRGHVAAAFGTPNNVSGPGGMTCAASWHNIGYLTNGTSSATGVDFGYCDYLLAVGSSIGVNKASPEETREFWDAKARGMKFVSLDTRLSPEAAKADEWIPIRGGTDLAFLLALNYTILYEVNKFDVDFIKQRTNGPYLIRSDNGLYMRSATQLLKADPSRKGQQLGKPYMWDAAESKAKLFDDTSFKDYALEGEYKVDGVTCKPAFQLMKDSLKSYTPEWAEKITTVPAATIRRVAKDMVEAAKIGTNSTIQVGDAKFPYRPVVATIGRGGQTHKWGTIAVEACCLVNLLLGAQETPGANVIGTTIQETGPDGTNLPKGTAVYRTFTYPPNYDLYNTYWPASYKSYWATWDAILNPTKYGITYSLDTLLVNGANPIFGFGSPELVTEAIKKIPFTVAISYHTDEPTELADVVLPDPGFPEWLHLVKSQLRQPWIEKPLYDTRKPEDVFTEIAARAGFLEDWNKRINTAFALKDAYKLDLKTKYTQEQILDRQLKSRYGEERGLAWAKVNGVYTAPVKPETVYGYYHNPKTRYHLYFEYIVWIAEELKKDMAKAGAKHPGGNWWEAYEPLPSWKPNPTLEAPAEFDLFENNYRGALMSMGFSPDNPWTFDAMQFDPFYMAVLMHKDTAAKKGLKDGDLVWVESYVKEGWSKVKGEVRTTEGVHPESIIIGGQSGRWATGMNPISKEGPHHNSLLSIKLDYVDQFSGSIEMGSRVKIYKAESKA